MTKNPHILELVNEYRYRKGIVVTDEKSFVYKVFKIIYLIAFLWTFIFNALFTIWSFVSYNFSEITVNITPAITLIIATVFLIAGLILIMTKLYVPAGILNVFSIILGTVQYYTLLSSDIQLQGGITHFFYWRHFFPAIILLISVTVICVIGIKSKILLNRDYKKVVEKIYIKNKDQLSNITDDDWQKLLESGELFKEKEKDDENF